MCWVCTAPLVWTRCPVTYQLRSVALGRPAASPAACWGHCAWSVYPKPLQLVTPCRIRPADSCVYVRVCAWTGVLQLVASGDLPADDWPAVAGRGPGQSGPFHIAAARPLWLLSVSVPRADGSI